MSMMSSRVTSQSNQKVVFYSACAVGMCAVFAALVAFHDGTGGGMAVLALSAVWFYNSLTTMDNGLVRVDHMVRDTKNNQAKR